MTLKILKNTMKTQPRNKTLVLIIAILLIANIATLAMFFMFKNQAAKNTRPDKHALIMKYLENEVKFSKDQVKQYEDLSNRRLEEMKPVIEKMSAQRAAILTSLAATDFADSALEQAANELTTLQRPSEISMFRHLKLIRGICTPEQRPIFDTGFYKIIVKRGSQLANEKK
jgi:periplasmic protein CpxP/Spy